MTDKSQHSPRTAPNRTQLLPDRPGIPPMAELPEAEAIDPAAILAAYEAGEIDLVCVLGPTASGKTRYAVSLARAFNQIRAEKAASGLGPAPTAGAEILSGDSRQVYRGMDIGTGKDLVEYQEIPYHLIDIAPAGARYDIYQFQQDFERAYKDIRDRGGIPILCGGSGLYIEAATCGYPLPQVPPNDELRQALEQENTADLKRKLLDLKPDTDDSVLESRRRVIRQLEVALYEQAHPVTRSSFLPKKVWYIGTLVSREDRVARIDRRLDERLAEGLADEVRRLLAEGVKAEDLMYYGLEYKYVTQYVLGILTEEEMRILLANAIHQFAKRQMTWFRGMERKGIRIHWTDPSDDPSLKTDSH